MSFGKATPKNWLPVYSSDPAVCVSCVDAPTRGTLLSVIAEQQIPYSATRISVLYIQPSAIARMENESDSSVQNGIVYSGCTASAAVQHVDCTKKNIRFALYNY